MEKVKEVQTLKERGDQALRRREFTARYGALLVFIALAIVNLCITPNFFSMFTVWNIIIQSAPTIITAMGMTLVIAVSGIDISVGSSMALSTIISTLMMAQGYSAILCSFAGIAAGFGLGLLIGTLTVKFDIQPMVLTLAFMIMLRSVSRITCSDKSIQVLNDAFTSIGMIRFGTVPIQLIYVAAITALFYIIAEFTVFGKSVEAIGNNSMAAKLSGIRSDLIAVLTYAILGGLAATAGLLTVARSMNCNPSSFGMGMEMEAIAAVVIGGTSMSGGKPRVLGTLAGCFIMTLITMTVNMNGIPTSYSMIFKAVIIVMAVYLQSDQIPGRRKSGINMIRRRRKEAVQ